LMPANLVGRLHRSREGLGYPRDRDGASACDGA
jgi:hypothetical protein